MNKIYVVIVVSLFFCKSMKMHADNSCKWAENITAASKAIRIQWVDKLDGDFSFKDEWSYPEDISGNEFGQLICNAFCPPEVEAMMDENRRIIADSLDSYYRLVDTTHYFHSIRSDARTYEWNGTDFITVRRIADDTVQCYTMCNAATHSSLILLIVGDTVRADIELNSITPLGLLIIDSDTVRPDTEWPLNPEGLIVFGCLGGEMLIDKSLWDKGILKASFHFDFENKEQPEEPMCWRGLIYAEIESQ